MSLKPTRNYNINGKTVKGQPWDQPGRKINKAALALPDLGASVESKEEPQNEPD